MEDLISAAVLAFFIVLIFGTIWWATRYEKAQRVKVEDQYRLIAEKFGLTLNPGRKGSFLQYVYPSCRGEINGSSILLYSYRTGGKEKVTYTSLQMKDQQGMPNFKMIKQGLFQKIAKSFGAQDIPTGNIELDEKYRFVCDDADRFVKALDSDMQQLLLHVHPRLLAPIQMKDGVLSYTFVNHIHTDERREDFEKVLVLILKFLKAMRK